MNSREPWRDAFESAVEGRIVTGDNQLRNGVYYYRSIGTPTNVSGLHLEHIARVVWQAATAHARDVAVRVCEEISQSPDNFRLGHTEAVIDCADAIKEALE